MLKYEGTVYRPPSEARSLLIQATIGCSYNRCAFCALYKDKQFRVRTDEEIESDLLWAGRNCRYVDRVFLCDGDALCLSTDRLLKIMARCAELFSECRAVNVYGNTRDVLAKGYNDLRRLAEAGMKIVYIGAESGSDAVLRSVNKGSNAEETAEAIRLIEDAGMKASVTFISGLGGRALTKEHAVESGRLISRTAPSYFSLLTLVLTPDMPLYRQALEGSFIPLRTEEVLSETELLFESISLPENTESSVCPGQYRQAQCIFRSNHVSNALPLRGTFPQDKQALISALRSSHKV